MTEGLSFSLSIITLKVREGNNLLARILSLTMDHKILIISTIFTVPSGMFLNNKNLSSYILHHIIRFILFLNYFFDKHLLNTDYSIN